MKKIVCIIIAIAICGCLCIGSIKDNNINSESKTETGIIKQSLAESPPDSQTIEYSSVENFLNEFAEDLAYVSFSSTYNTDISNVFDVSLNNNLNENSAIISSFLSKRINENSIYIPCVNNLPIELRQRDGYPTISVFLEEEYSQPWIWYFLETKDSSNAYIKIMYLDTVLEDEKIVKANNEGANWAINQITLQSQNIVSNLNTVDSTKSEITLNDKTVIAEQVSLESDSRVKVQFVYDEILVVICANPEVLTDNWFSGLNFKATMLK